MNKLPFIAELVKPLHADKITWRRMRPRRNEISLTGGVYLNFQAFLEPVLEAAYADFNTFLSSAGIRNANFSSNPIVAAVGDRCPRPAVAAKANDFCCEKMHYVVTEQSNVGGDAISSNRVTGISGLRKAGLIEIHLQRGKVAGRESFRIDVRDDTCCVMAEECEGVRRALIFLEDEMLRNGGPFLRRGVITRRPVLKTRMHLGHTALMPPRVAGTVGKLELYDGMPDEYLNRVVHDGANAIWISPASLGYAGRLVPEYGREAAPFIAIMRRMVTRYARYGLKVYLYGLVPEALPAGHPLLKKHPELRGHALFDRVNFCTSSAIGRELLEQAVERLFRDIPGLGGFVDICVGERPTHCYSGSAYDNNCPRCSKRKPWQVLADTLAAMERGMHRANPAAELIAWPYMQNVGWGEKMTADAAGRIPRGVILQHNFENGGHSVQLGKPRRADDYWLSYTGPAELFEKCAKAARRADTPIYAKAMVAGSHELASVPCIPAPGLVYRKIAAMRKLGVSGLFANWGSSNDPSVMQRAAGDLAFEPFPQSEKEFLRRHARRDWGAHTETVVRAWQWFAKAYRNYPLTIGFSYYGPMHNGVAWELNLIPRNIHLPRSWMPDPPVGDRIGDCTGYHTLAEIIKLCTRMRDGWSKGTRLMESLIPRYENNRARMRDIILAQALELHFISGVNILEFYRLREKLIWDVNTAHRAGTGPVNGKRILKEMHGIVDAEIENSRRMLPLVKSWPRLGYTPEAGIYKYNPELLRKRIRSLQKLLKTEFPAVAKKIQTGQPVFPEYTQMEQGRPRSDLDANPTLEESGVIQKLHVKGNGCAWLTAGSPSSSAYKRNVEGEPAVSRLSPVYRASRVAVYNVPAFLAGNNANACIEHSMVFTGPHARNTGRSTVWQAAYDEQALYLNFMCNEPRMRQLVMNGRDREGFSSDDRIWINIETSQFEPMRRFMVNPRGARDFLFSRGMNVNPPLVFGEPYQYRRQPSFFRWSVKTKLMAKAWQAMLRIPWQSLGLDAVPAHPLWINVGRDAGTSDKRELSAWITVPPDSRRAAFGRLLLV